MVNLSVCNCIVHFQVIWGPGKIRVKLMNWGRPPSPLYRHCPLILPFFLYDGFPKLYLLNMPQPSSCDGCGGAVGAGGGFWSLNDDMRWPSVLAFETGKWRRDFFSHLGGKIPVEDARHYAIMSNLQSHKLFFLSLFINCSAVLLNFQNHLSM